MTKAGCCGDLCAVRSLVSSGGLSTISNGVVKLDKSRRSERWATVGG